MGWSCTARAEPTAPVLSSEIRSASDEWSRDIPLWKAMSKEKEIRDEFK